MNKKHHDSCIEVSNLSFRYDNEDVLKNISFKVQKGDYLGIIGPNGGGKTTLIKLMLGLLKPSSGTIKIHGQKVQKLKDRTFIGYVPQRSSQNIIEFPATVEEIVTSGRTAKVGFLKRLSSNDRQKIEWAMKTSDVYKYRSKLLKELSGGQRQKVFIARALASEPEMLFLDEPTVAVDIASSEKFYTFLKGLNRKYGITILFITHDIDCVAQEVSSVMCLNQSLVCLGPPHEMLKEDHLQKLYGRRVKTIHHHYGH